MFKAKYLLALIFLVFLAADALASGGNGGVPPTVITGLITQGSNVNITGSGTSSSPYNISASGGGGGGMTYPFGTGIAVVSGGVAWGTTLPYGLTGNSTIVETNSSGLISASIVPTLNQNTTGNAANVTGTSNSTITTLSALSLPYSQLTSTPTLPANTSATSNQFFTAYNSSTGAFTAAQPSFSNISGTPSTTQVPFQSLTTTGTSGAATLSSGVLNIPQYSGGGGGGVTSFSGDGVILSNSSSTGSVTATLVNSSAGTILGNATSSSAAPTYTSTPQLGKSGTLGSLTFGNATSGLLTLEPATGALSTSVIYIPAASSDTVDLIGTSQSITGVKSFSNSAIKMLGSSTGATTFTSANAGSSNYTLTFPAVTDQLVGRTTTDTLTNKSIAGSEINSGTVASAYLPTGTVITSTGSPAQGDILYYNGSNWVDLPAGTTGYYLKTQGSSANPIWASVSGGSGTVNSVTFTGDGTVLSSTPSSAVTTSGTLTAALANQTANTVLGALTATTPSDLALPSCSGSTSALKWTSGTGFGCQTFGTASTVATGTSGATIPLLNGTNTWSNAQTFSSAISAAGITDTLGTTTPSINGGPLAGLHNMLINGDFRLDQHNIGASSTLTAGAALAFPVDRWFAYSTGGNPTVQQVAGPDSAHQYILQFTGAASTTAIYFGQRILATNSQQCAGNSCTISFDASDSTLTSLTCALSYANTANTWGTVASPSVTSIGSNTFTISSTLTRYTYTFSGISSSATTGLQVLCNVGAQTSGTLKIGNFQLEYGSQSTPFERIPASLEYSLAAAYYVELSGYSTVYGTCSSYLNLGTAVMYSTTAGNGTIPIPVQMWKKPSLTTSGTFQLENSTSPAISSFSVDDQVGSQLNVDIVTGTTTSGTLGIMRWNNTACSSQRFTINAETST